LPDLQLCLAAFLTTIAAPAASLHNVSILTPNDPGFEAALEAGYPGISSLPNYAAMRPFLVLIHNDGVRTAYAYAIEWSVHYPDGYIQRFSTFFIKRHWTLKVEDRVLHGSDTRLLSPLFNLSSEDFRGDRHFVEFYPPKMFEEVPDGGSVSASIDGIVFSGALFAGPNHTGLAERFQSQLNAEHDEGLAIQRYLNEHPTALAADIAAALDKDIKVGLNARTPGATSIYQYDRANEAMLLKTLLLNRGIPKLKRRAAILAAYPKENLRFSHNQ
jgi:hypothetical protein